MATSIISNIDHNYFEAALNQNSGNTLSKVSFYRTQATIAGGNVALFSVGRPVYDATFT